jgi:uncharacterized lipoprotein YbaY/LysM repeat protein
LNAIHRELNRLPLCYVIFKNQNGGLFVSKIAFPALAVLTLIGLLFASVPLVQASSNAQAACVETYTVVAGDTLGTIAQKYLGEIGAYPQIVTATNAAAAVDTSFKNIADANLIEVGQKLCIPAKAPTTPGATTAAGSTTPAAGATTAPTAVPTAAVAPLTLAQLGNATYTVEGAPNNTAKLTDGKVVITDTVQFTAQVADPVANGTLNAKPYAATQLIVNTGGSGTFSYVAAVPNNNGTPGTGVTALLGDRIKVTAISIANNAIKVDWLDRKPEEAMVVEPTVATTKYFVLNAAGALVEGQPTPATPAPTAVAPTAGATPAAGATAAAPTAVPTGPEGTYISTQPAADASALLWEVFLGPNSNASWLSNYVGKGTINATGTWTLTSPTTIELVLIKQEDKNINEKFIFEIQGDKLVATQYNQSLYGDSGITLYKANANVTGNVTYTEKIALPDDAVVEVYLVDTTAPDVPGTYISGTSNRANGQQVPIPFSLPYDSLQTNPAGHYIVQAFISSNGRLLFSNANGVAVITNGAPTSNVQVVVVPPAQ